MVNKNFDTCASFHINNGAFFGRLVRLDEVVNTILTRHNYPPVVSGILAESTALATLLASTIKYDGIFTLQTQSNGPVGMIVVDVTSKGAVRASANYDNQRIENAKTLRKTEDEHEETPHFLGGGYLAFTVDQGGPDKTYQGIVDIRGKTLAECAMRYFRQSEQIDTHIKLFLKAPETENDRWMAAGILLQKLPDRGGKLDESVDIDAAWEEAVVFIDSLKDTEIFDVRLSAADLLHRLFHANGLEVETAGQYHFGCRCSREKLQAVLAAMKPEEIDAMTENGKITAECHFCGEKYSFEKGELLKQ